MFPYGTQYYRTPNPPEGEWEKDFDNIASQGFTLVKIWAMWNWINYEEDKYDFAHFDTLFELARKNGLKILINVILENAPYWLICRHQGAFYVASNGEPFEPIARPNTPGGGWPGLCLDNKPVKLEAEKFLKAVGTRYANSDVLWGYDVWNEVFFELYGYTGFENRQFCYCEGSRQLFVEWLKRRYGTLDQLNKAWYRRYSDWAEVYPPRYLGSYPDWLDWLRFRIETRKDLMRWRVQTLRSVDKKHQLISHGVGWTLHSMPTYLTNDFDIAKEVDQWGLSSFPMWGNMDAGEYCRSLDLVRSASAQYGKRWWQSELQGGQSSMGLVRSRIPRGEDIAQWNWLAFMVGAKGLMYWQWRPELLGPESPGFGLCKLDGSRTDRTETASWFSRFMNSHPELEQAEALAGECAIVVVPESQLFAYLADGKTDAYWKSVYGIYRALWNVNVQVDFCTLDRVNNYPLVFLPFPLMLEEWQVDRLKDYVSRGGVLVSDAAPAHFTDHGYCSFTVPGAGLDEVFGAVEDEMEYVPTLTLGDVPP
ncbi:MAG: beta-galactosidase, partial [Armatimonadetes bacterium]|nr:beta-galactosidase [Armatimonadota bacterium]